MGAQIAAHCANAGLHVYLLDIAPKEGPKNAIVEAAFKRTKKLKPNPFFTKGTAQRVQVGNFDEHFDWVGKADWVIEAVVERLTIKRQIMGRIEEIAQADAVISTNTSGIPIREIAEGRSEGFRKRLLGTHFFNPPRYLKLLELIPTTDTDPAVVERIAYFGRMHLGKGIVVANDVPYFVGNRIGIYAMMKAMHYFTSGQYSIEEIDKLTGTLIGHPKSATFRTADVVGLDVMVDVANNLYEKAADDESREMFKVPALLQHLVGNGALGAKTKAGFYRKEGKEIKSINPQTLQYESAKVLDLPNFKAIKRQRTTAKRMQALFGDDGRAGTFFRESTLDLLGYAARRIPEITESPANVDRAICWGFGWELGPFQTWDVLGFENVLNGMVDLGIKTPGWVQAMQAQGITQFYRTVDGQREVYVPAQGIYVPDPDPSDEIGLAAVKTNPEREVWKNEDAGLLDLGDGVVLYEFRSKANTLGFHVMNGLAEAIERVENDPNLRGMVIGNEGQHFSVGANLGEVAMAVGMGQFDQVEQMVGQFQQVVQRVRYAAKPIVVAPHQRVLGGACELTMACLNPVVAAESYIGLVELGVGIIPAGTGTMHLAALAAQQAASEHPSAIMAHLQPYFENVAMARVATSAREAQNMGYVSPHAQIVMNDARRFHVAKQEVLRLSAQGYLPPSVRTHIRVLGRSAQAAIQVALYQYKEGRFVSEYDVYLATKLGHVLTGGNLTGPQDVHEDYLLDLEREAFMHLLGQEKTKERIMHLLTYNKPLRN